MAHYTYGVRRQMSILEELGERLHASWDDEMMTLEGSPTTCNMHQGSGNMTGISSSLGWFSIQCPCTQRSAGVVTPEQTIQRRRLHIQLRDLGD